MNTPDRSITGIMRMRRGSVSVMFAGMAIPMVLGVGLAVDYSFYVEAQAELSLAADAAALHAVRVAEGLYQQGQTVAAATAAGTTAATQWWNTQLATISTANGISFTQANGGVQFNNTNGSFTDHVSFSATVPTHIAAGITGIANWPLSGSAAADIASNSFSEFDILFDNSGSMNIGATDTDVQVIESLTLCSPTATAIAAQQAISAYSWNFGTGIGYESGRNGTTSVANCGHNPPIPQIYTPQLTAPTTSTPASLQGSCNSLFTGPAGECSYPPSITNPTLTSTAPTASQNIEPATGYCPAGTGIPTTIVTLNNCGIAGQPTSYPWDTQRGTVANVPQAPCGLACHTDTGADDYWTLEQNYNAAHPTTPITLRFDVVEAAAQQVMNTLTSKQTVVNQFAVGVYTFNTGLTQVHPAPGTGFVEADTNLTQAIADIRAITTPVVVNSADTDFPDSITTLANEVSYAGNGSSATQRTKNLIIITDGLEDDNGAPAAGRGAGRYIGTMTSAVSETLCQQMKAKGFNVFVLYTPYYPLPNPFYLTSGPRNYVEPAGATNQVAQSLQACASQPNEFLQASDLTDINAALTQFITIALQSPGRLDN